MGSECHKCDFRNCLFKEGDNPDEWTVKKCSACFSKNVHEKCCVNLSTRYPGKKYVFCSIQCCDRGPILSLDLSSLKATCKELSKNALKAILRSIPLTVYAPMENTGENAGKHVELKKSEMVASLLRFRIQMEQPEGGPGACTTRKTTSCDFRLVNVLFSDKFYSEFSRLGDKHSRHELDTGGKQQFWQKVADAYVQEANNDYNLLHFEHESFHGIDPSYIIPHSGNKLAEMWKEMHKRYRVVFSLYKRSGNHDPDFLESVKKSEESDDFENFVSHRPILMYIRKWLSFKPLAATYVEAALPHECLADSISTSILQDDVDASHPPHFINLTNEENPPPNFSLQRRNSIDHSILNGSDNTVSRSGQKQEQEVKKRVNTSTPTRASKKRGEILQAIDTVSGWGIEHARRKQETQNARNQCENEKVLLWKTKTQVQMRLWDKHYDVLDFRAQAEASRARAEVIRAQAAANSDLERRLQTKIEVLEKFLASSNLSNELCAKYIDELNATREKLFSTLSTPKNQESTYQESTK